MTARAWSRVGVLALALPLLGSGCIDEIAAGDDETFASTSQAIGTNPLGVKSEDICFSVHNPGDPIPVPIAVTGTRFSLPAFEAVTPNDRVILLMHGAVETREIFDGGKAGVEVDSSFARLLAKEGYTVITVDRAGYGESPYLRPPGFGFLLTPNSYVEMTHEIIAQIHAGTYTFKEGASCGTGAAVGQGQSSVILGGHSIGGAESMLYATRYHDIDGLISFAWNNTGAASVPLNLFLTWIVPQFQQGKDYVTFFPPSPSGVSSACALGMFSQPLAATNYDPLVVDLECANDTLGKSPSGELAATNTLRAANIAGLPNVGPTPALLTFADLDTFIAGANNPAGDPDYSGQEVALWQQQCNCDVSSYTQPGAGHAMFFHPAMPELVDNVVSWLVSRGLEPR